MLLLVSSALSISFFLLLAPLVEFLGRNPLWFRWRASSYASFCCCSL